MRSSHISSALASATLITLSIAVFAQETINNTRVWDLKLGIGAIWEPDFEGGKTSNTVATPILDASYRTQNWGAVGFSSQTVYGEGLYWAIIDEPHYSFGPVLSYDEGRSDKRKRDTFLDPPGSRRLRGLGSIDSTLEYGAFGSVSLGDVPITLVVLQADEGHEGLRAELSAEFSLPITERLSVTLTPWLSWADDDYMRSYFGVSVAQAVRTGRRIYTPDEGVKSYSLNLAANYQLTKNWFIEADYTRTQLAGDAADSPIVERKVQNSAAVSISYQF